MKCESVTISTESNVDLAEVSQTEEVIASYLQFTLMGVFSELRMTQMFTYRNLMAIYKVTKVFLLSKFTGSGWSFSWLFITRERAKENGKI